jgi:prolipoprotein diacylglyceryltransferase
MITVRIRNTSKLLSSVTLVISAFGAIVGVLVMFGVLGKQFPKQFAFMFGLVLFLYGVFRFVVTYFKRREEDRED